MDKNTNTAPAAEKTVPAMIRVSAETIGLQPRTSLLGRPAFFFLEPTPPKRDDAASEQSANYIEKGPHQVDPNRVVSCAPVMPSITLLRDTGNPYPADEQHPTVITSDYWRPFVKISHSVWKLLMESVDENGFVHVTAARIEEAACKLAGVGINSKGALLTNARYCVLDTLRDLRLYGLVESTDATKAGKKTQFRIVAEPLKVRLISEPETADEIVEKVAEEMAASGEEPAFA